MFLFLSACSSSQMKARKAERDKLSQTSRFYCEFINGEVYKDIDVALNLEMAKKCDADKPFSISDYRLVEDTGVMYCCALARTSAAVSTPAPEPKKAEKAEKSEKAETTTP
jgi:hypothetical protein